MAKAKKRIPPIVRLHYKRGELVMKEGDYGISIYKILEGHVRIFRESGDVETPLATLGTGEIFGEMTFLNKLMEARSASARAVDEVDIEVWHPAKLTREYEQMPPILNLILGQTLSRLIRMNKIVSQLSEKKKAEQEKGPPEDAGTAERKYHRKNFDQTCVYRPAGASSKVRLGGASRISASGESV